MLLMTDYLSREGGPRQGCLTDLAHQWAVEGDDVTVLTGLPNHLIAIVPARCPRQFRVFEQIDGYRPVGSRLYATPQRGRDLWPAISVEPGVRTDRWIVERSGEAVFQRTEQSMNPRQK